MDPPYSAELLVQELSFDVTFMESKINEKLLQLNLAVVQLLKENSLLKEDLRTKHRGQRDFGTQTDSSADDFSRDSSPEPETPPSFRQIARCIMEADAQRSMPIDVCTNVPKLSQEEIQNVFPKSSTSTRPLVNDPVWSVEEHASRSTSAESGVHGSGDEEWKEEDSKEEAVDSFEQMLEKAISASKKTFAEEQNSAENWEVVKQKPVDKQKATDKPATPTRARTTSRNNPVKIISLPPEFLGEWHAVKSGTVERKSKFEWKKCTKAEHRIKFVKNKNGTYTVDHRKFQIGDAVFSEQASGQRCVVVTNHTKGLTVLVRNASTTYNFVLDGKNLLETFKDNNVEHRIVSVKK